METRPTKAEELFLSLAYSRFYDLYGEIKQDAFWEMEPRHRFSRFSKVFAVYAELLAYEPFKYVLEAIKKHRATDSCLGSVVVPISMATTDTAGRAARSRSKRLRNAFSAR